MSSLSASRIVRIWEAEPDHWIVNCKACPNRGIPGVEHTRGKFQSDTHKEADQYWRNHAKTDYHQRNAKAGPAADRPNPEGRLLEMLLGDQPRTDIERKMLIAVVLKQHEDALAKR